MTDAAAQTMTLWALAWRLARREMRSGLKGFRIFLACLALGVAAIAAVGSLSAAIMAGLATESRALLGGDVEVRLINRQASPEQRAYLERNAQAVGRLIEMRATAEPQMDKDNAVGAKPPLHLVELRVPDQSYPLAGTVVLAPPMPLAEALENRDGTWGAVVPAPLMRKLKIKPGARVRVGEQVFEVRAELIKEPDEVASVFDIGPTFMIAMEGLDGTGLVQRGSQVQYHYRMILAPGSDAKAWMERLTERFPDAGWRVRGVDRAAPGVRRFIERMALFLTFAGLTALLVGGIGVSNAVRAYLEGKTPTIATFKCLGARSGLVFRIYLLQITCFAALGIVAGLIVGGLLPIAGVAALAPYLPVTPETGFYAGPLIKAAVFGLLTTLTFTLWPLGRARDIPAQALFRAHIAPLAGRPHGAALWGSLAGAATLALVTIATAEQKGFAIWFVLGSLVILGVLRAAAALTQRLAAGAPKLRRPALRLAIANLHRPGAATTGIMVSLGLGLTVLVAIALIQGVLSRQIGERIPETAPAFFFIDVQPDQVEGFTKAVTGVTGTGGFRRMPIVRGRIVKIAGVDVAKAKIASGVRWAVRGDRALTYSAAMPDDTLLVDGKWWPKDYKGPPRISIDASIARGFGVGIGDKLVFNILGRPFEAEIATTREIDWRSLRFDFAVVFSPGTLENAPHSYIAAIEATAAAEDAVERAAVEGRPNVSAIRVREALQAAAHILEGISGAVRGTAGIAILAGILVLAGAIATDQRKRVYDAVVFKVLGARRRAVLAAFLIEYGILGLLTGIIAAAAGTLTAWGVTVVLMDLAWTYLPLVAPLVIGLAVTATVALGFAGTWRALGQKAAPYLRNA